MNEWEQLAAKVVEEKVDDCPVAIVEASGRRVGDPVPNQFPEIEPVGTARIAAIGEAPGRDEDYYGQPFVGESGRILNDLFGRVGIPRTQVFVGNVCQRRPNEANDFDLLDWNGEWVQDGIRQLREDLIRFNPSIVLCLGNAALHLFKNGNVAPPRKGQGLKSKIDWPDKIGNWRGSLFESWFLVHEAGFRCPACGTYETTETFCLKCGEVTVDVRILSRPGHNSGQPQPAAGIESELVSSGPGINDDYKAPLLKCLATYHPAMMARDYSIQGYYYARRGVGDFVRLRQESTTRELKLPRRELFIADTPDKLEIALSAIEFQSSEGHMMGHDIEGNHEHITALSFAFDAENGICIPLAHADKSSLWDEETEIKIWERIKPVLEGKCPQTGTNFGYDAMCLAWCYGIVVGGETWDVMEGGWELVAELKKGLASLASLFTKEPFYKPDKEEGELKFENDRQFWEYSARDAVVTWEIWDRITKLLHPKQVEHWRSNVELFPWKLYAMLRGFKVDQGIVEAKKAEAQRGVWEIQARIDREATDLAGTPTEDLTWLANADLAKEKMFSAVCLRRLGGKSPKRETEVIVERWQPMRWNGRKWVKDGRVLTKEETDLKHPQGWAHLLRESPIENYFLKPAHKTVSKLLPFIPQTLDEIEFHVTKSTSEKVAAEKRRVWRRVKQIWKELRHESSANPQTAVGLQGSDTSSERDALSHRMATQALLGELSTLLGLAVNVGSNEEEGDTQTFLYQTCGLPGIFADAKKRLSREAETAWRKRVKEGPAKAPSAPAGKRITTSQTALDKLYADTRDERALWVLQLRRLRKVVTDLSTKLDDDGRIRCSISFVKETGRMAASESVLGTGTNLQALNKDLRAICVADEGCELGQVDFEGSDSWTVACECAALGDSTMLDDLRAGLRPAKVMCKVFLEGPGVNERSREQIKAELEENPPEKWLYAANKSGHHGYDYGLGIQTLIMTVLKFSMADLPMDLSTAKPIALTRDQAKKILDANGSRYPGVRLWQAVEGRAMLEKGMIVFPTGHVRYFYGRKGEMKQGRLVPNHETLGQWLASKPQYWTTKMIKVALSRLMHDPENRNKDGNLKVEALIAVHDSLVMQWKKEDRAWAVMKIRQWFDNPVEIAGQKVTIPFDGTIGRDWGMEGEEVEGL